MGLVPTLEEEEKGPGNEARMDWASRGILTTFVPCTVDREIFAVKNFSPVAWAVKIKCPKIKYTFTRFIAEPSGGKNLKRELFLPRKFPDLRYNLTLYPGRYPDLHPPPENLQSLSVDCSQFIIRPSVKNTSHHAFQLAFVQY